MFRINKILKSSLVNGPGKRYTIWFQGCSIHCKGCINPDTWDQNGGELKSNSEIVNELCQLKGQIGGLTLTGGEPLDQLDGLLKFLPMVNMDLSIFLVSGYQKQVILNTEKKQILDYIDILCSGPFIESMVDKNMLWAGSTNQIVEAITDRGKQQLETKRKYRSELIIDKKDASLLATGFSLPDYLKK